MCNSIFRVNLSGVNWRLNHTVKVIKEFVQSCYNALRVKIFYVLTLAMFQNFLPFNDIIQVFSMERLKLIPEE